MDFVLANGYGLGGYVPFSLVRQKYITQGKLGENKDEFWMHQALLRAMENIGLAAPNPTVGCVFVKDNQLLASGATQEFGGLHGERVALHQVKDRSTLEGATCYVTLEPCSHYGKQPPCVELLIECKISRCVIGLKDPYPAVNGQSIRKLRESGITVEVGILSQELTAWHFPFLFQQQFRRPLIVGKWAQTLDGCLADGKGVSQWITGKEARLHTHYLRQKYDAIMVGVGTILHDFPSLNARDSMHAINRSPIKIIYDPKGVLHQQNSEVQQRVKAKTLSGETTIYSGPFQKNSWLNKEASVSALIMTETLSASFFRAVAEVYQKVTNKLLQSVMVEGGASVLSQLISKDLMDVYHIFQRPSFLGKSKFILQRDLGQKYQALDQKLDLHLVNTHVLGQDVLIDAISRRCLVNL